MSFLVYVSRGFSRRCAERAPTSAHRFCVAKTMAAAQAKMSSTLFRFASTHPMRTQGKNSEELVHTTKSCTVPAEKSPMAVCPESGELHSQQHASPYSAQHRYAFHGRRGNFTPEFYVSPNALGCVDPVASTLSAGRTDTEWAWLKVLCFICSVSTLGSAAYAFFLPEHVKVFKDEPWSAFRH